jgi:hypothetical protein
MGGMFKRVTARFKKNRRAVAMSTPGKPFYTIPTIQGVGYGFVSGFTPGTQLSVDFDMIVSVQTQLNAPLPGWVDGTTTPNLRVLAVIQIAPTQVLLTFSGLITPGDTINIPDLDPAIRTSIGGFVQPGFYIVP